MVGECKNVIYMLYDENSQSFYVGKADDLKTRLVQHQKKNTDPIKNFTHFRYTLLNEEYAQYIYYIENHETLKSRPRRFMRYRTPQ